MHIKVKRIILSKLFFEIKAFETKEFNINLGISLKTIFPEPNQLIQHITFDLFHDIKDSPIDLNFTYIGHYSSEGEGSPTLQEFSKINAPAYIIPYARELIANITTRTGIIPTLIMPPLNIIELLKDAKEEVISGTDKVE
jgi:preprotein translocase subunit SecB